MNPIIAAIQRVSHLLNRPSYDKFRRALYSPQKTQDAVLKRVLCENANTGYGKYNTFHKISSYEEFVKRVPIVRYEDLETFIVSQMHKNDNQISMDNFRFIPTSGSTHQRKWIPFNHFQRQAFDNASSPWLYDLTKSHPKIQNGVHYWSLSWLPDTLRTQGNIADDLELFPPWKRYLWNKVMSCPSQIAFAETSEAAMFATACFLAARKDLSLFSVWSPTFIFSILNLIEKRKDEIVDVMDSKHWGAYAEEFSRISPPETNRERMKEILGFKANAPQSFWPNLALISAWDSHSSARPAAKLKHLFSNVAFQGKGLWATEGVLTIPFQGRMPIALTAHFYEFRNLETNTIVTTRDLKQGMIVRPVFTCGNGFVRYELDDQMHVDSPCYETPCLSFIGRDHTTDLCGEKLSPQIAESLFARLQFKTGMNPVTLAAVVNEDKPYYHLISEGDPLKLKNWEKEVEDHLLKHHHYAVARELGQLGRCKLTVSPNALNTYIELSTVEISGAKKIEPISYWSHEQSIERYFS